MAQELPKRVRRLSELDVAIARKAFHRLGREDVPLPEWVPVYAAPVRATVGASPAILRALAAGLEGLSDEQQ
ncbi:hypothetical protein [Streptomyces sp. NPDC012888]|uniref:hypothetical protein n=1 Tax=Streptomyces sp. NPDC012888 TaxID=3364855 RepID=UPI0036B0B3F7